MTVVSDIEDIEYTQLEEFAAQELIGMQKVENSLTEKRWRFK
jgi:hypothetical protein